MVNADSHGGAEMEVEELVLGSHDQVSVWVDAVPPDKRNAASDAWEMQVRDVPGPIPSRGDPSISPCPANLTPTS